MELQAVCSKILKTRDNIDEYQTLIHALTAILRHANSKELERCLDYVLFPFGILIDTFLSSKEGNPIFKALEKDSSIIDTLQCLQLLLSKVHLDEDHAIPFIQRLSSMLALPAKKLSEEPRCIVAGILVKIFEKESSARNMWLSSQECRPLIGSVISILLCHPYNDVKEPSNIATSVQMSSLRALTSFLRAVGHAESLAFFVPGIVTGLVKRILIQIDENIPTGIVKSKNSSGVIASLKALQELLEQVFSDKVVDHILDESCCLSDQKDSNTYHTALKALAAGEKMQDLRPASSAEVLSNLDATVHTDKDTFNVDLSANWVNAAVIRISTFLKIIFPKLCRHNNSSIRVQIAQLASSIVSVCCSAFKENDFAVDALLLLAQDVWPSVKSIAGGCLSVYLGDDANDSHVHFRETIFRLPKLLKDSELTARAAALRLCSYSEYSYPSPANAAVILLSSAESSEALIDRLIECFEIDLHSLMIVARGPSLAIMGSHDETAGARHTSLGRSSMPDCLKYINSRETYKSFARMIQLLTVLSLSSDLENRKMAGSSYVGLVACCLRKIKEARQVMMNPRSASTCNNTPWQIQVTKVLLVLIEIIDGSLQFLESKEKVQFQSLGISCCKGAILDVLYTMQDEKLWLLKTSFIPGKALGADDQDTLNSILQHNCLILIGVAARCLKSEFSSDGKCMHVVMLPVIEKFASSYQYVSSAAKNTLNCMCRFCGYTLGLEDLVQKNIDYVVDGMCLRLRQPSVYPDAPKLFAALLKQNGVAIALMPLLSEPADHAIRGISIIQRRDRPECVLSFVLCTMEIAKGTYHVATSAYNEMNSLAESILNHSSDSECKYVPQKDDIRDDESKNATIEEIADYFNTRNESHVHETGRNHIYVCRDTWEGVTLSRKRLSSAAILAQSIVDSVGPLSVSKTLPVAVQSFKAAVQALQALKKAHTGLEIFRKHLEEHIQCEGQIPVVEAKSAPAFLPSIHLLWTPLMGSLNDWRVPVVEQGIVCLRDIVTLAPTFLARRFTKEAWPKLKYLLRHGAPRRNLIVPGHDDTTSPALDARIRKSILHMMTQLASSLTQEDSEDLLLPISRHVLLEIIGIANKIQETHEGSQEILGMLKECYVACAPINPDAAWIILYEHGGISQGISINDTVADLKGNSASHVLSSIPDLIHSQERNAFFQQWEPSMCAATQQAPIAWHKRAMQHTV